MPKKSDLRVEKALKQYVTDPRLALSYDRHYEDTALLDYDSVVLSEILRPKGLLLDVGCGTGRHLIELTKAGHRCVGIDLSAHMLDLARAKLEHLGLQAEVVQADMRRPLPFADGVFDHVICMFSTIGLIPSASERLAFVREAARVLKPGGTFATHVHNRLYNLVGGWGFFWLLKTYTWDRLLAGLEVGDRLFSNYRGVRRMFLHVFSLPELRSLLSAGGLTVTRVVRLDDDRTGEITGRFASIRANGFIVSASKPAPSPLSQ